MGQAGDTMVIEDKHLCFFIKTEVFPFQIEVSRNCKELVLDDARQDFGLGNPVLDLAQRRELPDQALCIVNLNHFGVQVGRFALSQFGDGVHTGLFQQIGIFFSNTLDPVQIGMVDPLQNEGAADTGFIFKLFPAFWCRALFKELIGGGDADSD